MNSFRAEVICQPFQDVFVLLARFTIFDFCFKLADKLRFNTTPENTHASVAFIIFGPPETHQLQRPLRQNDIICSLSRHGHCAATESDLLAIAPKLPIEESLESGSLLPGSNKVGF
jgi:hypothetical protein